MGVIDKRIQLAGGFLLHRDLSGAAAVDPTTINDTNFPPADAFNARGAHTAWAYWTQTGGAAGQTLNVQPLIRNGVTGLWVFGPVVTLTLNTLVEIPVRNSGAVFLRIDDVTGVTGTAIKIRVATAEEASHHRS